MPIHTCTSKGRRGKQWGHSGKCYLGATAKRRAQRQAAAIHATGWVENETPTTQATADTIYSLMSDITRRKAYLIARTIKEAYKNNANIDKVSKALQDRLDFDEVQANMVAITEMTRIAADDAVSQARGARQKTITFVAGPGACDHCLDLDGLEFTLKQAAGLIPVHPNCRCGWETGVQNTARRRRKKPPTALQQQFKEEFRRGIVSGLLAKLDTGKGVGK